MSRPINRGMRNAGETVSNLRYQISEAGENIVNRVSETGENIVNRVRGRGRPRLVPRSDENIWDEPYPAQVEHPVTVSQLQSVITGHNQTVSASTLQAALKRTKENKTLATMKWENEMAQNEQNRNAANTLTAAVKRTKTRNNHAFDVMADISSKDTSASTLQAAIKRTLPAPKKN